MILNRNDKIALVVCSNGKNIISDTSNTKRPEEALVLMSMYCASMEKIHSPIRSR